MVQEQKTKEAHRPMIFSSMLMSCYSDELLLQKDLPLKEKPENQNEVKHFMEQSTPQDHWQAIFLLLTSHSDKMKSQMVGFGSDFLTAMQKAIE